MAGRVLASYYPQSANRYPLRKVMLQKIRDKITGWFAATFLGAIAVVFIFWGIQFESSTTTAAATVNGEKIPAQTLVNAWQERQSQLQQQLRDELPPELVKSEQQKLVDDYIARELLVQRANESGYRVSDRSSPRHSPGSRRCRSTASSRATATRRCCASRAAARPTSNASSAATSRPRSCRTPSPFPRSSRRAR